MNEEPIQRAAGTLDEQAADLFQHYGALPWAQLPEATREHFRKLVRAGVDGAGRPLAG